MADENPRMNVSFEDGIVLVELKDHRILDEMSIMRIGEQLNALVARSSERKAAPGPRFVIDFTNVAHMSSSALGVLITVHKRIRERQGQLRLCCIQAAIHEIFVITRLNEIFQICQTRQEAIDSLK